MEAWNFSSGASSRARSARVSGGLARDIHVLPEFLGNRSPFADPDARAVVAGMDLDVDIGRSERLFVAGLCGLAYGLADVVEILSIARRRERYDGDQRRRRRKSAGPPDHGGYDRAERLLVPKTQEPVLLGAAMLGAVAAKSRGSIGEAMASMSAIGRLSEPAATGMTDFHRIKRKVHGLMRKLDFDSRDAMREIASIAGLDTKN